MTRDPGLLPRPPALPAPRVPSVAPRHRKGPLFPVPVAVKPVENIGDTFDISGKEDPAISAVADPFAKGADLRYCHRNIGLPVFRKNQTVGFGKNRWDNSDIDRR